MDKQTLRMARLGFSIERDALNAKIAWIDSQLEGNAPPATQPAAGRTVSPAARKRMAAAQRKRWAKARQQKGRNAA